MRTETDAVQERLDRTEARVRGALSGLRLRPLRGRIRRALGGMLEAELPLATVGELCRLERDDGETLGTAEVVGLSGGCALLSTHGDIRGLSALTQVVPSGRPLSLPVGDWLLGRMLDGLGRPLNGAPPVGAPERPVLRSAPPAMQRALIDERLPVGVPAIDAFLTCAVGQRIGVSGPAGVGKSSLLARILRHAEADIVVLGLIGERGREVRDFVERRMSPETRARSVVVVSTAERPAAERLNAAQAATTVAEHFRDQGRRVLLLIDSVTRFARALRELGLAAGEPPARRGFPPSVFMNLPKLFERAGPAAEGSITAFYTVLSEGDDEDDPIVEEVRALLDGEIRLSRTIAEAGRFPAIDVLKSRSRLMDDVVSAAHRKAADHIRSLLSRYEEVDLLVKIGEYEQGSDPVADEAVEKIDRIRRFLSQEEPEAPAFDTTLAELEELAK